MSLCIHPETFIERDELHTPVIPGNCTVRTLKFVQGPQPDYVASPGKTDSVLKPGHTR